MADAPAPLASTVDAPEQITQPRLQGRSAIVTGAGSGIGLATVRLFSRHGAKVIAVDLPGKGLAESVADYATPLEVDITEAGAAERIVDAATTQHNGLDILMNNAGVSAREALEDISDESWARVLDVNLNAAFRLCRAGAPWLKKSTCGGRIINTSSVMAEFSDHGLASYSASKAGIAGLTRNLALDLGRYGVTANHIMPGAIVTGMTKMGFSQPDIADIWARKSALKRLGQPIDVARVALFLASDDGGFVTGQGLAADGGLNLRS